MKEEKMPLIMKHGNEDISLIKRVSFLLGRTVLQTLYTEAYRQLKASRALMMYTDVPLRRALLHCTKSMAILPF